MKFRFTITMISFFSTAILLHPAEKKDCYDSARQRAGAILGNYSVVAVNNTKKSSNYTFHSQIGRRLNLELAANSCKVLSANLTRLSSFEQALELFATNLVIFWSPHSILDENNFATLKKLRTDFPKIGVFLILDPLADPDYTKRALKKAGIKMPGQTKQLLTESKLNRDEILSFSAGETNLAGDLPLCEFPLSYVWQRQGDTWQRQGEWAASFPVKEISATIQKLTTENKLGQVETD